MAEISIHDNPYMKTLLNLSLSYSDRMGVLDLRESGKSIFSNWMLVLHDADQHSIQCLRSELLV